MTKLLCLVVLLLLLLLLLPATADAKRRMNFWPASNYCYTLTIKGEGHMNYCASTYFLVSTFDFSQGKP
jgi:hypothetical protein